MIVYRSVPESNRKWISYPNSINFICDLPYRSLRITVSLAGEKKKVCSLSPSSDRLREIFGETDIFKVKIADMRKSRENKRNHRALLAGNDVKWSGQCPHLE